MISKNNFSVIIPHKNSPDLLVRCLKSIPKDEDIQVIVVDDNSDLTIANFDDFPGNDIGNVELVFTKNGNGAGFARNVGLSKATGKWIIFADADDFFERRAFEVFRSHLNNINDVVYFGVKSCYSETLKKANRGDAYRMMVSNHKIINNNYSENILRYKHIVPWGKMIKRNLLKKNNILFDEVKVSNDLMFSVFVGHYASSIDANNEITYCVTYTKGSLTNHTNKLRSRIRFKIKLRYNTFVKQNGKKIFRYSIARDIFESSKYGLKEMLLYYHLAFKNNPTFFKFEIQNILYRIKINSLRK